MIISPFSASHFATQIFPIDELLKPYYWEWRKYICELTIFIVSLSFLYVATPAALHTEQWKFRSDKWCTVNCFSLLFSFIYGFSLAPLNSTPEILSVLRTVLACRMKLIHCPGIKWCGAPKEVFTSTSDFLLSSSLKLFCWFVLSCVRVILFWPLVGRMILIQSEKALTYKWIDTILSIFIVCHIM
jgi:hypothetical protein